MLALSFRRIGVFRDHPHRIVDHLQKSLSYVERLGLSGCVNRQRPLSEQRHERRMPRDVAEKMKRGKIRVETQARILNADPQATALGRAFRAFLSVFGF